MELEVVVFGVMRAAMINCKLILPGLIKHHVLNSFSNLMALCCCCGVENIHAHVNCML